MESASKAQKGAWGAITLRAAEAKTKARALSAEVAEADLSAALAAEIGGGAGEFPSKEALERPAWDQIFYAAERSLWLLPGEARWGALRTFAEARAAFPAPKWEDERAREADELGRAFARAPSGAAEQAFLDAARSVEAADSRLHLLLEMAPLLSEEARGAALSDALDAALAFPDEVHVAQQVAAVVLRDPKHLLGEALRRGADAWSEEEPRASLLEQLADTLPAEHLGPVLDAAGSVADEWSRVNILSALRARLLPDQVSAWETLASSIEDEGLRDMLEPPTTEAEVPSETPGSVVDTLEAWGAAARASRQEPTGQAIAEAIARFIALSGRLFARD